MSGEPRTKPHRGLRSDEVAEPLQIADQRVVPRPRPHLNNVFKHDPPGRELAGKVQHVTCGTSALFVARPAPLRTGVVCAFGRGEDQVYVPEPVKQFRSRSSVEGGVEGGYIREIRGEAAARAPLAPKDIIAVVSKKLRMRSKLRSPRKSQPAVRIYQSLNWIGDAPLLR